MINVLPRSALAHTRTSSPLGFLMIDAPFLQHCHDRHGRLGRNRIQVSER